MQLKSFSFKTSDGTELWVNRWIPDQDVEIKGLVQLNHGMQEHSLRYDRLGSILAENGYVLNAFDMRGHGKTAEIAQQKGKGKLGKIANHGGAKLVINDLRNTLGPKDQNPTYKYFEDDNGNIVRYDGKRYYRQNQETGTWFIDNDIERKMRDSQYTFTEIEYEEGVSNHLTK